MEPEKNLLMKDGCHIEPNGDKSWWKDGKLHREDGPAVEWVNGYQSWWMYGFKIQRPKTEKEKNIVVKSCPGIEGEDCLRRNWIPRNKRRCEYCSGEPVEVKKPVAKRGRKFKKPPEVNMQKLLKYVNKNKKVNFENVKVKKQYIM